MRSLLFVLMISCSFFNAVAATSATDLSHHADYFNCTRPSAFPLSCANSSIDKDEIIHIASGSNRFAPLFALVNSILQRTCIPVEQFRFHLFLFPDPKDPSQSNLQTILDRKEKIIRSFAQLLPSSKTVVLPDIRFIEMNSDKLLTYLPSSLHHMPKSKWNSFRWQEWLRLWLIQIFPSDMQKYIWFDDDMIVETDVANLWTIPMLSAPLIAVDDVGYTLPSMTDVTSPAFSLFGVSSHHSMIQAGLQIVDLQRLRSQGRYLQEIESVFLFMIEHNYWLRDQVIFSLMIYSPLFTFKHRALPPEIPYVWDLHGKHTRGQFEPLLNSCREKRHCILHWNGAKPWAENNIWGNDIWNEYGCPVKAILDLPALPFPKKQTSELPGKGGNHLSQLSNIKQKQQKDKRALLKKRG